MPFVTNSLNHPPTRYLSLCTTFVSFNLYKFAREGVARDEHKTNHANELSNEACVLTKTLSRKMRTGFVGMFLRHVFRSC